VTGDICETPRGGTDTLKVPIEVKLLSALLLLAGLSGAFLLRATAHRDTPHDVKTLAFLSADIPTEQTVGEVSTYRITVTGAVALDANRVPVLYLQGMESNWRVIRNPMPGFPSNPTVGSCDNGEHAPFLVHETVSPRIYIQIPDICTIVLHVVPLKAGRHTLALRVYTRQTINKKGVAIQSALHDTVYRIDRRSLLPNINTEWNILVQS